jgi:hypothetical protein
MKTEAEHLADLKALLTQRIEDPAAYVATVKGKPLKQHFQKLIRMMQQGDELWEWEWWGTAGPTSSYSFGWCVVRRGEAIASHCHSSS